MSYRETTDEIDEALHRDFETLRTPLSIIALLAVWGFVLYLMLKR